MENASHAIMIAAGVLLAMVITGLLIFAFRNYTNFRKSEYETTRQEQITETNKEIESYNRKSIKGLQLISLINTIQDKNDDELRKENNIDDSLPKIKLYLAVRDKQHNDVYDNNPTDAYLIKSDNKQKTEEEKTVYYFGVNTSYEAFKKITSENYKTLKDTFNGRYCECTGIEYENKSGYITEVYIKERIKK